MSLALYSGTQALDLTCAFVGDKDVFHRMVLLFAAVILPLRALNGVAASRRL